MKCSGSGEGLDDSTVSTTSTATNASETYYPPLGGDSRQLISSIDTSMIHNNDDFNIYSDNDKKNKELFLDIPRVYSNPSSPIPSPPRNVIENNYVNGKFFKQNSNNKNNNNNSNKNATFDDICNVLKQHNENYNRKIKNRKKEKGLKNRNKKKNSNKRNLVRAELDNFEKQTKNENKKQLGCFKVLSQYNQARLERIAKLKEKEKEKEKEKVRYFPHLPVSQFCNDSMAHFSEYSESDINDTICEKKNEKVNQLNEVFEPLFAPNSIYMGGDSPYKMYNTYHNCHKGQKISKMSKMSKMNKMKIEMNENESSKENKETMIWETDNESENGSENETEKNESNYVRIYQLNGMIFSSAKDSNLSNNNSNFDNNRKNNNKINNQTYSNYSCTEDDSDFLDNNSNFDKNDFLSDEFESDVSNDLSNDLSNDMSNDVSNDDWHFVAK